MVIVICGGEGQLAREFAAYFKNYHSAVKVTSLSHGDLDITQEKSVLEVFKQLRPHVVINTVAYHKVDECERNVARSFNVNAFGGYLVAKMSRDIGARSMYFSTNYVFDGAKATPYEETDIPNPLNIYGHSKALAERLIHVCDPQAWIVRTNGLFGRYCGPKTKGVSGNFVDFVLGNAKENADLEMVSDQNITPTFTADLVKACVQLILENEKGGIFHITNSGETTWFEIAEKIYALVGSHGRVKPITTEERNAPAMRPKNAVLANNRLKALGFSTLPDWKVALRKHLELKGVLP